MNQPGSALYVINANDLREIIREEIQVAVAGLMARPAADPDELLTTKQAAEMTGLSENTLSQWRCNQDPRAPKHLKAGPRVRYRRSDIEAWLNSSAA